jgi:hypothetical protein
MYGYKLVVVQTETMGDMDNNVWFWAFFQNIEIQDKNQEKKKTLSHSIGLKMIRSLWINTPLNRLGLHLKLLLKHSSRLLRSPSYSYSDMLWLYKIFQYECTCTHDYENIVMYVLTQTLLLID